MIKKIYYNKKTTNSNNIYYEIEQADTDYIIGKLMQINYYMGELSLSKNKDIKDLINWYQKPTKQYPFSTQFKRNNSPNSFVSGMLNNFVFGNQRDLSESQVDHIQNIVNMFSEFKKLVETDYAIYLQKDTDNDTLLFVENLFTYK